MLIYEPGPPRDIERCVSSIELRLRVIDTHINGCGAERAVERGPDMAMLETIEID